MTDVVSILVKKDPVLIFSNSAKKETIFRSLKNLSANRHKNEIRAKLFFLIDATELGGEKGLALLDSSVIVFRWELMK